MESSDRNRPPRGRGGRTGARRVRRTTRGLRSGRHTPWIAAIVVAGLVVAGVIGFGVWQALRPEQRTVPSGAVADGYGLPTGDGAVEVEIYLDFLCPVCREFDRAARPALEEYLADGTVTLVYRPIAILDRFTPDRYSTRAAAGAACAADADAVDRYVPALLDNQPAERSDGLSDERIVAVAADHGITGAEFADCVPGDTYHDWVDAATTAAAEQGVTSTPTVMVAGDRLPAATPEELVAAVDAAAAGS